MDWHNQNELTEGSHLILQRGRERCNFPLVSGTFPTRGFPGPSTKTTGKSGKYLSHEKPDVEQERAREG